MDINAEAVEDETSGMWRTMFKLSKTFAELPGPKRVAESIRNKIDKFKSNLPLLNCICNPGLRDRHWSSVSIFYILIDLVFCFVFFFCFFFFYQQ